MPALWLDCLVSVGTTFPQIVPGLRLPVIKKGAAQWPGTARPGGRRVGKPQVEAPGCANVILRINVSF